MDAKDLLIKQLQEQMLAQEAELLSARSLLDAKEKYLTLKNNELQELLAQQTATTEQFAQSIEQKNQLIALLEQKIKRLLSAVRGSRQERIDPNQLMLFSPEELQQLIEELENPKPQPEPTLENLPEENEKKAKKRSGRRNFPKHFQEEVIRHEIPVAERSCPCCGEQRSEIGMEESRQLDIVPMSFKVIVHQRIKYACKSCQEQVSIASKPPQPIEKGIPAPGLCAYVTLSKFGDHQPLYREEDLFNRIGWTIRRSTLCEWLAALAGLAGPLVARMKSLLLQSSVIHTDDTKIKMMQPLQCHEAKFWPYQGDWLHPYVVFDFTLDRKRYGPANFLVGYEGYLQADAFSGYDCLYAGGKVREVACWIHTRRYWHQSLDSDPIRANTALGFIARLVQIESELRHRYPEQDAQGTREFERIAEARQKLAVPILASFKQWLDQENQNDRLLPKSEIRQAFTYTLNQWEALCRYTEAGYLSLDNNAAERNVKYPAIGRKNFLFVGNQVAGNNAAIFYSLVTSAKRNGVEPYAWLRDIYSQLPQYRGGIAFSESSETGRVTVDELDHLLPDRWLKEHPHCKWSIEEVRRIERKQKEQAQRFKRKLRK